MKEKIQKLIAFFRDWDNQSGYLKWMLSKTKPFIRSLMLIFVINTLVTVIGVGSTVINKHIIDGVTGSGQSFTTNGVILLIIITALSIGLSAVSGIVTTYINERYAFGIRAEVYDNVLRGVWPKIRAFHSGDIVTRLTSDINSVASGISSIIPDLLYLIIRLVIAFGVLFHYDHFLAFAALLLGPVGVVLSLAFSGKLKKYQVELSQAESEYRAFMQETVENLSVMKAFQQEDFCSGSLASFRNRRLSIIMSRNKLNTAMNLCIRSVFYIGYLTAFCWSIYRLSTGSITYGTMTVFISLVSQVQGPIMGLGSMIPQLITVLASVGRILEIDNINPEEHSEYALNVESSIGLRVSNVFFGYGEETVLEDVSLDLKPNDIIGVVGASGSGKTTLASLILSLNKPSSGGLVFYNEAGITEKASASARRFISYVPQGNTLVSGTISENLRTGKIDATEEEMWRALETADALSFVKELKDGLSTRIGENGTGLSEGQAQRIAIARAIIKDAPILILDEATSALDAKTEERVIKHMCESNLLNTCIIITHRRSMLAYCTRAIEIENKQIIELGAGKAKENKKALSDCTNRAILRNAKNPATRLS